MTTTPSVLRRVAAALGVVASLALPLAWSPTALAADTVQSGATLINLPAATERLQRAAEDYVQASARGAAGEAAEKRFSDLRYWSRIVANGQNARRLQADKETAGAGLPAAQRQRGQEVAQQLKQRSQQMEDLAKQLSTAAAAKDAAATQQLCTKVLALLKPTGGATAPAQLKPNSQAQLDGQGVWPAARPGMRLAQLNERLFGPVRVAAAGSLSGLALDDAADVAQPAAADLAFDTLTQPDAALVARVAELGANPVRIQNWVRNNVRFVPGWGVAQNAVTTHAQRQGNAYDIATLLISMLRQAQVPARYVYGTIDVNAANVQNWLGTDVASAAQLLARAKVPAQVTATQSLQLEHVWVDAWVPGTPSRGAVRLAGDSWWPLDASFKTETQTAGLDLPAQLGLNAAGVLDAAQSGAICTPNYAAKLNSAALNDAYAQYRQRASSQLTNLTAGAQVGDVLGRRQILAENYGVLLGTQPYGVVVRTAGMPALPDTLRWHLRLRLSQPGQAQVVIDVNRELTSLQGRRLTLAFVPETADDASTLAAQLPRNGLPLDIPAYLVKVKAELRLDGQLLVSGGSFTLGQTLALQTDLGAANAGLDASGSGVVLAGELHAWAFDGHGQGNGGLEAQAQPLSQLASRIAANQLSGMDRNEASGVALTGLAQAYIGTLDASSKLFQRTSGMREYRLPSVVRAASRLEPVVEFGIVTRVKAAGVALVVDRLASATAAGSAGAAAGKTARGFSQQSLERANAAAHRLLDQTFAATDAGHSAVRDLARANALGQRVYRLEAANAATALADLNHAADIKAAIAQATANGLAVLVPQDAVDAAGLQQIPIIAQELPSDPAAAGNGYYVIDDVRAPWAGGSARIAGGAAASLGWAGLLDSAGVAGLLPQPLQRIEQSLNTSRTILGEADGLSWTGFVASDEVIDGVFAAALNRASTSTACDWVGSVLASQLGGGLPLTSRVNRPPEITSAPVTYAAAGSLYSYAVVARDADGDPLRYRLAGAGGSLPSGLVINASGLVTWASAMPGTYALVVQVDDGSVTVEQRYALVVGSDPAPLSLSAALSPSIADAGQVVNLSAVASGGNGGAITVTATLDGTPLVLTPQGDTSFAAPGVGTHKVTVTAQGAPVNGATPVPQIRELVLSVRDPADATPPSAIITSPAADAEVTKVVTVTGTATDDHFAYYQLLIRPAGASDSSWVEIARGLTAVSNGALGQLDPTRLTNGSYELALRVVDVNGQQNSVVVPIEVARDLKLGQFKLSFTDISVDAAGMPLKLTRTYDSSKKDVKGDFGWGWSATANDVTIRKNMALGLQWEVTHPTLSLNLCLAPIGHRRVTVSMPDGGVYRFQARNDQQCAVAQVPPLNVVMDGLPLAVGAGAGSGAATAKLEIVITDLVLAEGGMLVNADTGEPWNPTDFKFTSPEGFVYYLREGVGVLQVTDPYGNVTSYGANGYLSQSSNVGLQLQRNGDGQIVKATDPAGNALKYTYNAAGELASVTDRVGRTTRFDYGVSSHQTEYGTVNNQHLLSAITDPTGRVVMQNQFDEYGRLVAVVDADGQKAGQSFDVPNNRIVVTDKRGNVSTYTFDDAGNVTKIVDSLGGVTAMVYDAAGNKISHKDPLGNELTRVFDSATGKVLSETDALGRKTVTTYPGSPNPSERGNPLTVTDPNGNVLSYSYGGKEKVAGVSPEVVDEPLGRKTTFNVDQKGNLRSLTLNTTSIAYDVDSNGRWTKSTDAVGNVTTYQYDVSGNQVGRTIERMVNGVLKNEVTSRKYDAEKRVIEEVDPTGALRKWTYNAAGRIETRTDALGRTTRFGYDASARPIRTDYPDGTSDQVSYDANGNETGRTDRLGHSTINEYDELNRLIMAMSPDGSFQRSSYDAAGRLVATMNSAGARQAYEYDAVGQLTASQDASGRRNEYKYDLNGNRIEAKTSGGDKTSYVYDALNRLIEIVYPDGSKSSRTFATDGRISLEVDTNGLRTEYSYDLNGNIKSVKSSGVDTATTYSYDEKGAKISQGDALNRKVKWTYDAAGRPASRTMPDGSSESFQYDQEGNVLMRTTFGGQRIQSTYDSMGRELTRVTQATSTAPSRTVQWTYDAEGRRLTQTESGRFSSNGVTRYRYDTVGRLVEQDGPQGKLNWAYDASGNVVQRTTPEGTANYSYDGDGRLSQLTAPDGGTVSYIHDAAGRLSRSVQQVGTGLDLISERRYDFQGRPIAIAHLRSQSGITSLLAGQHIARTVGGFVNRLETFGSGAAFDIASGQFVGNPDKVQLFSYDANMRLAKEEEFIGSELINWLANGGTTLATRSSSYEYDQVGNRTAKTVITSAGAETTIYAYDVNDRLSTETRTTSTGSQVLTTYGWDGNGNLASKSSPGQYTGYVFDAGNRLVEVTKGVNQSTAISVAQYGYDADGQRIRKEGSAGTTHYLIDRTLPWAQLVQETLVSSNTSEVNVYVWGAGLTRQVQAPSGATTAANAKATIPLVGHLDTPLGAIDGGGQLVETYQENASGESEAGSTLNHLHAGEYFDKDVGGNYMRARWYLPGVARFASVDPVAGMVTEPKSFNRYVYAWSDPVNRTDPSGRFSGVPEQATVADIVGILSSTSGSTLAAQVIRSTSFAAGRTALGMIRAAAPHVATLGILATVATKCILLKGDMRIDPGCKPGYNVFIIGDSTPQHRSFVADSIMQSYPFSLTRQEPPNSRAWLRRIGCKGSTEESLDCDEYPYAASHQGGEWSMVNTRILGASDNRSAGASLQAFYARCGLRGNAYFGDQYFVVPLIGVPTVGLCAK